MSGVCILTIQRTSQYQGSAISINITDAKTNVKLGRIFDGGILVLKISKTALLKFHTWDGAKLLFDASRHISKYREMYHNEKTPLNTVINLVVSLSIHPFQYTVLSTGESEKFTGSGCCTIL